MVELNINYRSSNSLVSNELNFKAEVL